MKKIQQIKSKKQVAIYSLVKNAAPLVITLLLMIMSMSAFSQSTTDFKKTIDALKNSTSASDRATGIHMKNLAYELNPTLFISEDGISTSNNETPICGILEDSYLSTLYTNNPKFERIEFLTIMVSNPTNIQTLDITKLTSLKSLRYIHFIFKKQCTNDQISKLAKDKNSSVKVYYSIEIPK
jgi:hypothetical protein